MDVLKWSATTFYSPLVLSIKDLPEKEAVGLGGLHLRCALAMIKDVQCGFGFEPWRIRVPLPGIRYQPNP